ncbi:hypothetical protein [Trinickia soli]|uniref:Uncharacterized protein n=1 Tax=Trinickia soli TaxID=380675 RepID=A0A2N7WEC8_9BURK|nr:hypothetical protein [Trinickia soli]PMS27778.1 hypothetical protein C0Z19_03730 [Trinickia soli]CAB3657122.1 hypothetical protein LMG24076_01245 [Trinickia soli]
MPSETTGRVGLPGPQAPATERSPTIPRSAPPTTAQDYAALIARGLDYCQRLTQDSWTDYNEHDPGVTILEQLCYALTDLGLRNTHAMPVLLAAKPGTDGVGAASAASGTNGPGDTLVTGERILTNAPWTLADYRRMLYDRVTFLKNAWLAPPRKNGAPDLASGLYEVRVESYEEEMTSDADRASLLASVAAQMRAQRNLGEDLAGITLLKAQPVTVCATIEVGVHADTAQVLADVLFALQQSLVPSPKVQAPGALLQKGVSPDAVFVGPRLGLGVIEERDLADYKRRVTRDELVDIMLSVPGVRRVSKVRLEGEEPGSSVATLLLRDDAVPRLSPSIFEPPKGPYKIEVELEGGIAQAVDTTRVYRLIEARVADLTEQQNYTELETQALDYGRVPTAPFVDLGQYTSIQYQFPMTYGIGREGVPALPHWRTEDGAARSAAPPVILDRRRREALAQQLKGYLLLFEQLLANHLAQLANAWQLFALESGAGARQSYYYQPLIHTPVRETDPPDVFALLAQTPGLDGTERMQHGVYVVDDERRVVLVGRETGSLADAQAVRAELVRRGGDPQAYRVERVEHRREAAQWEWRLVVDAADGSALAIGEERYGSSGTAQAARARVAALLARCADDPPFAARHLVVRALSGIVLRIVDESGRIVLDSGSLPTLAERAQRESDMLEHGTIRSRYRLRRDDNGWLRLTLHNAQRELIATGEIRFASIDSARDGREQLIEWLRRLSSEPTLNAAYIERLPASDTATTSGYLNGLQALTARFDPAVQRRNRFLDHLLARFGEHFDNALLQRLDPRRDGGAALPARLQRAKTVFLANIVPLSYGRATGIDYGPALPERMAGPGKLPDEPAGGYRHRLALLLGIEPHTDANGRLRTGEARLTREPPPFLYYVARDESSNEKASRANRRSYTFSSAQSDIVSGLLKHGVSATHYDVTREPAQERTHDGTGRWILTFTPPGGQQQAVHRGDSREAVLAARDRLIRYLNELANDPRKLYAGEGFHVVEHVLLRPETASVSDDFYRQRVSLIFPDWPVRFQDPEFRAFAQRTVFENTPVHLDARCYWIGLSEMTEFERLNDAWRAGQRAFASAQAPSRPIDEAADLRRFIERIDARGYALP